MIDDGKNHTCWHCIFCFANLKTRRAYSRVYMRMGGKSMNFKGWKKIWRVIERMIWAYLICGITFSLGYAQFCTDKIQAKCSICE